VSGVAGTPLPVVILYGARHRVAECARCELVRPVWRRGLCRPCAERCTRDGTLGGYGYVKADRVADFIRLRLGGADLAEAARRVGVSERTGWRYEAELAASGRAPWREWSCAA
jgi:hypothetical protein